MIAGANGAGKSRLSPFYVHCKSFDGDLLALKLRKEHPDWIERWISGTVASELQKQKTEAIAQHKDFAFETNFSNDMILNMSEEFKEAGYKISLLYFGLGSLEESTTRVMQRKLFGGHDVANEVIEYNFYEGIKRVQQNLHLFDNICRYSKNRNLNIIPTKPIIIKSGLLQCKRPLFAIRKVSFLNVKGHLSYLTKQHECK